MVAALLGSVTLAACAPDLPASQGLSGTVVVDGSSTLTPLLRAVADELVTDVEPGVTVDIATSGTGAGIQRLCAGTVHVAMAARSITAQERAGCADAGVEPVEVPVGLDAVSVVVPRRNDYVRCLTVAELASLWGATGPAPATWQDVREDWPPTALSLFSPGPTSGTATSFVDVVLDGSPQRLDVATSEDDEVIVQGVAASPGGLGYVPLGHALGGGDEVRVVAVDAGDGCVEPAAGTATDGSYPMSGGLQVYVSRQAYTDHAAVAALVGLLVARASSAAEQVRGVPPTSQQQQAADAALDKLGPGPG